MSTSILLSVRNISKFYKKKTALKDVSLQLYPGEIVSLLGVNGAGKTTLSSVIATLHPPTYGEIYFDGSLIYQDLPAYRKQIGYCPQQPNLHPLLSIRDNLHFAGKYYGMNNQEINIRLDELNQRLGIYEYLDYYPTELSGGWKQRYMIARTLLHRPKLVILDEPTVALDPDIRHQLWFYIRHIKASGACVLLTTHYLEEAEQLSDRICLLDKGEIKLVDTPKNLMQTFQKGKLEEVFLQLIQQPGEVS